MIYLDAEVAVIGGGLSGMCAALASARHGAKTVLIQERPVLGGNQSSEMQVGVCGADCSGGADACYVRETGIIEELMLEQLHRTVVYADSFHKQDVLFWEKIRSEPNITMLLNTHANCVIMDGGRISAVECTQSGSEKSCRVSAKIFIDATGDGTIAAKAGAEFLMGRESKYEFGESMAPEISDGGTMGSSIFFNARDMGRKVTFTPPEWAYKFPKDEDLPYRDMSHDSLGIKNQFTGFWWLEYGGVLDTVKDNEEIRDELYKIVYGVWDHMKNHGEHGCENYDIVWMNVMPAKRESRRIVGDYIVNENDVRNRVLFEDRVAYGGWPIDIHPPEGIFSKEPPSTGERLSDVWNIPFRSLYSKNIPNLMMAGRDISVTHVALGSSRVMATCSLTGQAAGMAAQLCVRYGVDPKDIRENHIKELQQSLLKDDCYIKDMPEENETLISSGAEVTTSSSSGLRLASDGIPFGLSGSVAMLVPISKGRMDKIRLFVKTIDDTALRLRLIRSPRVNAYPEEGEYIGEFVCKLNKGDEIAVFDFDHSVAENSLYWIVVEENPDVSWLFKEGHIPVGTRCIRKNGRWIGMTGSFALEITPESHPYEGHNVVNGISRPEKWTNLWISDETKSLPQRIELVFNRIELIRTIVINFDSDLTKNIYLPAPWGVSGNGDMPTCVKDYDILAKTKDGWETLFEIRENYLRHRKHIIADPVRTGRIAVKILATNGDPTARIYDIKCYSE